MSLAPDGWGDVAEGEDILTTTVENTSFDACLGESDTEDEQESSKSKAPVDDMEASPLATMSRLLGEKPNLGTIREISLAKTVDVTTYQTCLRMQKHLVAQCWRHIAKTSCL